jgi:hypothetical protein
MVNSHYRVGERILKSQNMVNFTDSFFRGVLVISSVPVLAEVFALTIPYYDQH